MDGTPEIRKESRWPGLLLSFFVPGFGLFRAGLPRRAFAWFSGMLLLSLIVGLSLALSIVPIWLVVFVLLGSVAAQIWMLCDGFRPGRMTWPLWLHFIVLLVALYILPSPILSVARSFRIPTSGMEPTFLGSKDGSTPDHVAADLLSYRFNPPQRGDIVVFSTTGIAGLAPFTGRQGDSAFVQRLVGMPGETIRISDGKVIADGRPLGDADGIPPFDYENPRSGPLPVALGEGEELVVGSDEYFVLGDNVSNSLDSRYWGCVPKSSIIGKVTMIYYPFGRMRREF